MHTKEKSKKPDQKQQNLPPIRNKIEINVAQKLAPRDELITKAKRDNTPMPDYYKAWDKIARQAEDEEDVSEVKFKEPK